MPDWYPMQTDFTGGEISARMVSRLDSEKYDNSLLAMVNWMPRFQGSAVRTPGSQFILAAAEQRGRILPYLTVSNVWAMLLLLDRKATIYQEITPDNATEYVASAPFPLQIVGNSDFGQNQGEWQLTPSSFTSRDGALLGCRYRNRDYGAVLIASCRDWENNDIDNQSCQIKQTVSVPVASDNAVIEFNFIYESNGGSAFYDPTPYTFRIRVGSTMGSGDVFDQTFNSDPVGTRNNESVTVSLPSAGYTGNLFIQIDISADDFGSEPVFAIDWFRIFTNAPTPPAEVDFVTPYDSTELADIHYVQSPYGNKELFMFHPNHAPQVFFFDSGAGQYVFQAANFTNTPSAWAAGNYPATCSAYQGRLIAGGTPQQAETCWGSKSGDWFDFTLGSNADDAIEFTSIYRSPIEWIYGHKDFLIGAREYEYAVTADGQVLTPSDLDVRLHSTHGGGHVQPAGFGQFVAFAAERGTRVRASQLNRDDEGWIAPDLTLYADHITASGIVRMVRMRNPHQMLVCVLGSGDLAILHHDSYVGISGWSRLNVGETGSILDAVVIPDARGLDILYLLVRRTINNQRVLYVEAIVNWDNNTQWRYLNSSIESTFDTPTNIIDGLDHLNGERVQVLADGNRFLGTFQVINNQVTLLDAAGSPILISRALVGIYHRSRMTTLPPRVYETTGGLAAKKRYSEINVRTIGSTRPLINGERYPDRDPISVMDRSQTLDIIGENEITLTGWDELALITVEEDTPFPCEVIAIHGKLTSNNL